jgi:NADP-dependent 3-hydroxy acid dehydrogenase YdfG
MNRLKGKKVIITGASSGIGKALAEEFAEKGCNLFLTGRRKEHLDRLKKRLEDSFSIEVHVFDFDIQNRQACINFAESLKDTAPDILINNAGLAKGVDSIQTGSFEDWDAMLDTNVKGLLTITRLFLPAMLEKNSGHVINISSTAAHEAYPGGSVYCASKHAVKAITEATKKDVHGSKVRVSMISPGLVETEFSSVRFHGDQNKANAVYKGMEPLTALDIAEIVVFMANRPAHVNIMDAIVMPVNQSSAQMVHRNE